ncbi:MAG: hypothetical protein IJI92_07470 [Erysipelotrichaceae bacterium]|nr:hypothetical protein [Erysipelotrichaceae bacterium]
MSKKVSRLICVCELLIAVIMYFAIAYHFDNDEVIVKILPNTDLEATLLRLSIYIIPGINIIAGVFGITFSTKGILCFAGVMEILGGIMTLYFKGISDFMNKMGILMIALGIVFIICVLISKEPQQDDHR